jgi:hypothetical protein
MNYRNKYNSFEQHELESRRKEFHFLERRLVKLQCDLDDLRDEIAEFETIYAEQMSDRISELDSLEKELGRLVGREETATGTGPDQSQWGKRSNSFDEQEQPAARVTKPISQQSGETLKDVYRKVAKAIHPDLSRDEGERKKRQTLMAEANRAYAEEDHVTLVSILQGFTTEADFVRERISERAILDQRIMVFRERIRTVETEILRLKGSDLYRLVQKVQQARNLGKDILAEMAAKLELDILAACRKLNRAKQGRSGKSTSASGIRTLDFLPDRSVGYLYVRNALSRNFLDWRKLGEAMGSLAIPNGTCLRLDVAQGRVADLALLTALSATDLHGCYLYGVANGDLAHVLRFRGIEELYISGHGITAEGLIHLLHLPAVERLYLYDTHIGDEGLVYLKYLKRLRYVTFCNSLVSDAGLQRLKGSLASCTVINLPTGRPSRTTA